MKNAMTTGSLVAAILTAITASLCCVGPLVLLMLGIGGAWVATLTHLDFLRPISIAITLFFLGVAYWKLYISPGRCSLDKTCIKQPIQRGYRFIFWVVTVLLLGLLSFPWYTHLFY